MTNLIRWDPFSEYSSLRRALDRVFDDFGDGRGNNLSFAVDLYETGDDVVVKAMLPGVAEDDVEISVTSDALTIKGETRHEEKKEEENYFRREIRYGAFSRMIPMPTRVDSERVDAEFQDGILTVRLPKAEDVRPRSIKVRRSDQGVAANAGTRGNGASVS